jgi:protein-tyrosine phosphatase
MLTCGLAAIARADAAQAPSTTPTAAAPSHLVTFEGSNNTRDLGGYTTTDGHTVRTGLLYRSAALNRVTPAGFAYLKSLGVRTNVDFRSTDERAKAPVVWPADMDVKVFAVDYTMDTSGLVALFTGGPVTAEKTSAAMVQFYRQAPFQFGPQYKTLVHEILVGHTPVVYNCTAGKDRTGVASAVLLTLLGVPRETVVQDYLLSNTYYRPDMPRAGEPQDPQMAFFRTLSPDVIKALMGVDRRYLEAAFDAIESRPGGWDRYVHEDLALSDADVADLKTRLLQ